MTSTSPLASIGFSLARTSAAPLAAAVGLIPKVNVGPSEELSAQGEVCTKIVSQLDRTSQRLLAHGQANFPEEAPLRQRLHE